MVENGEGDNVGYSLLIPLDLFTTLSFSLCLESNFYGMHHSVFLSFVFQLSLASKCWQETGGQKRERSESPFTTAESVGSSPLPPPSPGLFFAVFLFVVMLLCLTGSRNTVHTFVNNLFIKFSLVTYIECFVPYWGTDWYREAWTI